MKYAVATILDQTHGYYAKDDAEIVLDCWTIKHPHAFLFDSEEEAMEIAKTYDGWVEPVYDEAEFRAREDTW